jgi:hypothetical protein
VTPREMAMGRLRCLALRAARHPASAVRRYRATKQRIYPGISMTDPRGYVQSYRTPIAKRATTLGQILQ